MSSNELDYFDHDADIGIVGSGDTIEQAFCAAAKAVFNIMTVISKVSISHKVPIEFVEDDIELALVTWLNALLAKAREHDLIFAKFELTRSHSKWIGYAYGDHWQERYIRGTEVKGATLTMLEVSKNEHWQARCVVDV